MEIENWEEKKYFTSVSSMSAAGSQVLAATKQLIQFLQSCHLQLRPGWWPSCSSCNSRLASFRIFTVWCCNNYVTIWKGGVEQTRTRELSQQFLNTFECSAFTMPLTWKPEHCRHHCSCHTSSVIVCSSWPITIQTKHDQLTTAATSCVNTTSTHCC